MLTREFLKKLSPSIKVTRYDLDEEPGKNRKEDEAGALAIAHHFDFNSRVVDFMIEADHVTIFIER